MTFKLQGGEIKTNTADYVKVVDYGQSIGTVPTPSYGEQTFEGWFTQASGGTLVTNVDAITVTNDITYYAHWGWKPKFQTDGGTFTTSPSYALQDSPNYALGTLPAVTRDNYTFAGWYYLDANNDKVYISDANNQLLYAYASSIDLSSTGSVFYADWEHNATAQVTLDPNGGSYKVYKNGLTSTVTEEALYTEVYSGQQIGELPTPTKAHADFAGWYDDTTNTKYTYSSTISENVKLTAHWTEHSFTVTFDPTEGEMAGSTEYSVASGKTFTYLPGANCVENIGNDTSIIKKSFEGWYTEPNGGGTKLTTATQITGNVKYYANWVDNKVSDDKYTSIIRWNTQSSADVTNVGDTLVFHPQGKGNVSAQLFIDFSKQANTGDLNKDAIRITIPKTMFLGWDDEDVTSYEGLFPNFTVTTSEDGQNYILTNNGTFSGSTFTPDYTVDPMSVKGGYTDDNGVYQDYFSKTFKVKIELYNTETQQYEVYQERDLGVEFHTEVHTAVMKDQSTATLTWDSKWGTEPADSNEYFYVIWNLKSSNINSNQPYRLQWSEGTVHDGTIVYAPDLGKWSEEYTSDSSSTVQVVTKHPLKEAMAEGAWANVYNEAVLNVKWKSGYEEQFRSTGKAAAFVGEDLADGVRSLTKEIPEYGTQSKHYVYGGQDLILNSDAEELPEFVYNLTYREGDNDDNPGWSGAGEMIIDPRTYVISDGVKGRNDVLIAGVKDTDTNNKNLWTSADQTQLDDGDYYFTKLDITLNEYDSVRVKEEVVDGQTKRYWAKPYQNNNLYDYHNIIVYIRKMGSDTFETLKTFYRSDYEPIEGEDGGYTVSITLPADTVGYKIEYTSHRFATEFKISTGMKFKSTRKLYSLTSTHANAGKHTIIKNKAQVDINREESEKTDTCYSTQFNAWRSSYELTLSESELRAAKSCLSYLSYNNENDRKKYFVNDDNASTVEFPVAVTGWTYNKNQLGYIKRVKSGTFHDLLPYGFTVDKSKVIVCGRTDEFCAKYGKINKNSQSSNAYANSYSTNANLPFVSQISSDYYSIRFVEGWEGSNQTMMIIDINCPEDMIATGFVVYYKCKTTYNNLHINGATPKNYVAFTDTTPEQSLPESRSYSRDNIDDTSVKALFASVDSKQTAYCHGTTTLKTPDLYQYGADSSVYTEGSDVARHQVVGLNTDYSYNISYEGSTSTKTQNLVIYDVIERYIGGNESEWEGTFKSIDVSKIKSQPNGNTENGGTCAPVVYYLSTDSTLTKDTVTREMFNLDYELNGNKIWSTTKPDNEKVVAIAVDCRTASNGKAFELGIAKGLDLMIYMTSPDDETHSDIETYNEAVITGWNPILGQSISASALTSVTLRFMNPTFVKSAFPGPGTVDKPESVVKGSVLNYVLTITNPDPELPMYDIVMEDEFPLGLVPNNAYTVRFNEGESISIDNTKRVNYTLTTRTEKDENDEDVEVARVFTTAIDMLDPGETVEITIPVKVTLEKGDEISNEAKIISINGVEYTNLKSNKTYHVVTGVKAKILKVDANHDPLSGATLQIYENNTANWDAANGKIKEGATPMSLSNDGSESVTSFTSTDEVIYFDVPAGNYILHETATPNSDYYKLARDIPFTIDVEGIIHVNGEDVNYVEMVDDPVYKIVFHENQPNHDDAIFKTCGPKDLNNNYTLSHFYDIPEWAGDEYVFAGWYHVSGYTATDSPDTAQMTAANFAVDTYPKTDEVNPQDYHLYAKWIQVGTVQNKDNEDKNNYGNVAIRGFGLAGVQIRDPQMTDTNFENNETPQGMRFIASLSEDLYNQIDILSETNVDGTGVPVEYGFVVGTEENINTFTEHYGVTDPTKYKLQYKGENVNGVNTTGKVREVDKDYRYITNVNCTSKRGYNNTAVPGGVVDLDHENFGSYRLYTLVVTYEGDSAGKKGKKLDARAYIRYYDANGMLRVFYNDYMANRNYGGCMCSFNQVSSMALPVEAPAEAEETEG